MTKKDSLNKGVKEEKKDGVATSPVSVSKEKSSKKLEKKKKEKNKERKGRIKKTVKETTSELKKVTWPKFKEVSKKTGVVLVVVLIFGLILLGIDYLLGLLFGLLK